MEAVDSFRRESAADGMAMEQAGDTFGIPPELFCLVSRGKEHGPRG